MAFVVIIPARWASTRLPGKMLADLAGKPLIVRTAERACQSNASRVVVATDHAEIAQTLNAHGYETVMTDVELASGTDRLAQAARLLDLSENTVVVNVQGDEPLIEPALINELAACLEHNPDVAMATAATALKPPHQADNPNVVKVVCDNAGRALYFSRAPIPNRREPASEAVPELKTLHHIGVYAYRASFLHTFPQLTQGLLERAEMLEQLRVLEHGFKIQVLVTTLAHAAGIDSAQDLEAARLALGQPIIKG